jgi:ribosomal-protein-alanine N-acetyltransferase
MAVVTTLRTDRLVLRPLQPADFPQYSEVRTANRDWLRPWEPQLLSAATDPSASAAAFTTRCSARDRERQLGSGYAFGVFREGRFGGEVNVNNVVRGAFRSAHVGYWVDQRWAGAGVIPEALVAVFGFAFDEVGLHRLEINIIPRNERSRRVVEKLDIRCEGLAERLIEINGIWEDHLRFAITGEEWTLRSGELRVAAHRSDDVSRVPPP